MASFASTSFACQMLNLEHEMAKNWLKKAIFDHFFFAHRSATGFVLGAKSRKGGIRHAHQYAKTMP